MDLINSFVANEVKDVIGKESKDDPEEAYVGLVAVTSNALNTQ